MEAENNCFWESTNLWKKTLGKDGCDVKELKDSYYNARQNAKYLLDKIMDDFPNLTVHDISHVDALWRVADTIIGPSYPVNPLEGYVLGVAFLIHDAALSYAAVGGIDSLRATVEWQDAYADGRGDIDDEAFKKECDFFAIRSLHALNAETLLKKTFKRSNGTSFFIIDNDSYREHYGEIIGRIAKSHHWDIDKVKRLDTQVNPMADNPVDWEINEQKLACILRCADAGHLDNKRAPDSLYFHRSLSMNGISLLHWTAQNRLGQVKEYNDDSRLLQITSTNSFTKDDFGAWNVAYEAIRVFDEEIKKSNDILKDKFPHQGVYGANSKEVLATKVKARGWLPCDLSVHTSNVKAMIENLGGSKLYGNDNLLLIALRELVQNSRDAVLARRTLDSNYVDGYIKIRLKKDGKRHFIEVEDDGIGMSKDCIKYHLLDFGSSYWKSPLSKYENRGLRSRGFSSVGKFGIGFYSVFMVARSVEVLSRRYESNDDAILVEFPKGLTLSPIMSEQKMSPKVSTIVRFELKDEDVRLEFQLGSKYKPTINLSKILSVVFAGLDVDVFFESNDGELLVHPNVKSPHFNKKKWLCGLLLYVPSNIDMLVSKLEQIKDKDGNLRGLLIAPEWISKIDYSDNPKYLFAKELLPCIKTIGGLSSNLDLSSIYNKNGFLGYVDGVEDSISRNKMLMDTPLKNCLLEWVKSKYRKSHSKMLKSDHLSTEYLRLITFFGFENEIIQDNLKMYYTNYTSNRYNKVEGTIFDLIDIHKYLTIGILSTSGVTRGVLCHKVESNTYYIDNKNNHNHSQQITTDNGKKYRVVNRTVKIINQLPVTNYSEIINKYSNWFLFHPFEDVNKRTLGLLVNLMIDRKQDKMINWESVDYKKLISLLNQKGGSDKVGKYLKSFLSQDYLNKMIEL